MNEKEPIPELGESMVGCFGWLFACVFIFGLMFAGCSAFMNDKDDYDYDYKRNGEDYNQDGEYQPADSMTDEEIEEELTEIIENNQ